MHTTDDGIPSILTLRQTEAALNVPVVTLRSWIRNESLRTIQLVERGTIYVPRTEVESLAELLLIPTGPDWKAVLNLPD